MKKQPKKYRHPLLKTIQTLRRAVCEALRYPDLTGRERRVLIAVLCETIGFGRGADKLAGCRLVKLTGIDERNVWRILRSLDQKGLVNASGGGFRKGHCAVRSVNLRRLFRPKPQSARVANLAST